MLELNFKHFAPFQAKEKRLLEVPVRTMLKNTR